MLMFGIISPHRTSMMYDERSEIIFFVIHCLVFSGRVLWFNCCFVFFNIVLLRWPPFEQVCLSFLRLKSKRIGHCLFFLKMKISLQITGGPFMCVYWLSMCVYVCVHVTLSVNTLRHFFYFHKPFYPMKLRWQGRMSSLLSPFFRCQTWTGSQDLNPVLPAIVWLSYHSSTAVSAEKRCHPPCCQDYFDLGICHKCWCILENKCSSVHRNLQNGLVIKISPSKCIMQIYQF